MKNNKSKNIFKAFGAWLKEKVRKTLVALKKNPQAIPLASLCITFIAYSINLTSISKVTLSFGGQHMGLATFATMLFMILSFVCMLNAFPKRQKVKIPMVILMVVLYAIVIFADVHFMNRIMEAITRDENRRELTAEVAHVYNTVMTNIVLVVVTTVLALLEPVFAKLLKKINTSIEIEEGQAIDAIEISDEE